GGVVARHRLARRRQPAGEVQDDEVVALADPLDPAQQVAAGDGQAGLLGHLADHGVDDRLPRLDPPTRHRPGARTRAPAPTHQEQATVTDDDGAHAQLGPHGSGRWTRIARATMPADSKKFLVSRMPGRARLSMPVQPRSVAQAMAASSSASPTPTPRA